MELYIAVNGLKKGAAEYKIAKAAIVRRNAAGDELKLSFADGEFSAAFAWEDTVEVFLGGERKFFGKVSKTPTKVTASGGLREVRVHSPWRELEEIVYQQAWTLDASAKPSVMRSKVILGQNAQGAKISVSAQIADIIGYAISCGASLCAGEIGATAEMLYDEARDITCAQALLRALKWSPDCSVFFDYSASGAPSLNIVPRASLQSADIDEFGGCVREISVCPRPDLAVSGVSVKYEREDTEGEYSRLSVDEENYPEGFDSASKRALVMSVDLDGSRASCSVYELDCETINPSSEQWWKKRAPSLRKPESISILSHSRELGNYPRELLSGSLNASLGFEGESERIDAKIKTVSADGTTAVRDVSVIVRATNATGGKHYVWRVSQYAEPRPFGLARAIYEAASAMTYEGSAVLIGSRAEDFAGKKINVISAENPEWATMNSPVVSCEEDLFKQTTSLKFGPPKHLYPDDISELFRINRSRKIPTSSAVRSSGRNTGNRIDFSGKTPETRFGEDGKYERIIIARDSETGEDARSVDLNVADIEGGETAKMREIYVCKNGMLAKAKTLMTDPKTDFE